MFQSIRPLLALLPLCIPALLRADAAPQSPARADTHWSSSVQYENDVLESNDYYYTSGLKLNWVSPDLSGWEETGTLRGFLAKTAGWVTFADGTDVRKTAGFCLGQNIYTPWNTWTRVLIPRDRPFCGWLYAGALFTASTEQWMNIVELDLGVTGDWSQARQAQKLIHSFHLDKAHPAWKYQIGNEAQANLAFERRQRVVKFGSSSGAAADLFASAGGSLGTLFIHERLGATVRAGWNLPSDFAGRPIQAAGDAYAPTSSDDSRLREGGLSLVFFCDYGIKAVQRDGTIDGNYSRESIRVGKMPFVQDFSFGLYAIAGSWTLAVAQVERSPEIKNQLEGWQTFHSITVAYTH
jgi:hypothetical protein